MISEVSKRYARALFDYSVETKAQVKVGEQLEQVSKVLSSDVSVRNFIQSPVVAVGDKKQALLSALGPSAAQEIVNLVHLLLEKGRVEILAEISQAFTEISDSASGVTRGVVRTASALNEDAKKKLEATVSNVTGKKVILNYVEDKSIVGGLIAQVGGWTFDDSLKSHLTRLSEELNRRA